MDKDYSTVPPRILELLAASKARNASLGLGIRCPECNAGIGKHCIGASHEARIVASR